MKKKGFTLVELLAVIAILAILVIIALPNVLQLFNEAKQNTFITEVRTVYKTAQQKFVTNGGAAATFTTDNGGTTLDLDGKSLTYSITFDSTGSCDGFWVSDGVYMYVNNTAGLKIEDIEIPDAGLADTECETTATAACFSEVDD